MALINKAFNVLTKHLENLDIRNIPPTIVEHSKEYGYKYKSAFNNDVEVSESRQNKTTESNQ